MRETALSRKRVMKLKIARTRLDAELARLGSDSRYSLHKETILLIRKNVVFNPKYIDIFFKKVYDKVAEQIS